MLTRPDLAEMSRLSGSEARARIGAGLWTHPTAGVALGWAQANLVVVTAAHAAAFLEFCAQNQRACPVLEVTDPGSPEPRRVAPGADVRTDLPRYRVYRDGAVVGEVDNIVDLWQPDFRAFLLGCSFSFEAALARAGIPLRHIELWSNVAMYRTNRQCQVVGPFQGPLVVSMRPIPDSLVELAVRVSSRFP